MKLLNNFKKKVNTDFLMDRLLNAEQRFNATVLEQDARYRDDVWWQAMNDFNGENCYE